MEATFVLTTRISAPIENPTVGQIAALLDQLPTAGEDDYLIVERAEDEFRGISLTYLQTRPHRSPKYEGIFMVEHRDGVVGRHYRGYVEAGAPLAALFKSYLRDDAWRELVVWRDISFEFDDLRAVLPAEEFAASFFEEREWQQRLKQKSQNDKRFWEKWNKNL